MFLKHILTIALLVLLTRAYSQVYVTRTGYVSFYASTSMEDIKAENVQLNGAVDIQKKQVAFSALLKGFEFKKELMQTHFNENYVESDKYPKTSFAGTYTGNFDAKNNSPQIVQVKGMLTLHGVTRPVETPATLQLVDGKLVGQATFSVSPSDYNITIPALVREKIAKTVKVEIKINADPK